MKDLTANVLDPRAEDARFRLAATTLRIALGAMFLAHGWLKVSVFTVDGTVAYFASLGLPAVAAYAAIGFEIIGGALLIAGIGARWISLIAVPLLLCTIALVHGQAGWLFSNEGGGWEYPAFLVVASIAQSLMGNGAFAAENALRRLATRSSAARVVAAA